MPSRLPTWSRQRKTYSRIQQGMHALLNFVILKYNLNGVMMYTTNLRKVGGSVMLAVPPALLDLLHLQAGASVGIAVDGGRLVVDPQPRPRYTLTELLAASDYSQPQPHAQREWVDAPAVGGELI